MNELVILYWISPCLAGGRLLQCGLRILRNQTVGEKVLVGVIMGSQSDWDTMQHAAETLSDLGIGHETRVVSAHRTPDRMFEYAEQAAGRGLAAIIAGAGGAAHLPGMVAAKTVVPVLGVPIQSKALNGMDSLLSIAQMPAGIPVGTLAIGKAGAVNAALLAAAIVALQDDTLQQALEQYRRDRRDAVLAAADPSRA
jgi:5-(carboxyamino)imidazole ribonucleotide mutase